MDTIEARLAAGVGFPTGVCRKTNKEGPIRLSLRDTWKEWRRGVAFVHKFEPVLPSSNVESRVSPPSIGWSLLNITVPVRPTGALAAATDISVDC